MGFPCKITNPSMKMQRIKIIIMIIYSNPKLKKKKKEQKIECRTLKSKQSDFFAAKGLASFFLSSRGRERKQERDRYRERAKLKLKLLEKRSARYSSNIMGKTRKLNNYYFTTKKVIPTMKILVSINKKSLWYILDNYFYTHFLCQLIKKFLDQLNPI